MCTSTVFNKFHRPMRKFSVRMPSCWSHVNITTVSHQRWPIYWTISLEAVLPGGPAESSHTHQVGWWGRLKKGGWKVLNIYKVGQDLNPGLPYHANTPQLSYQVIFTNILYQYSTQLVAVAHFPPALKFFHEFLFKINSSMDFLKIVNHLDIT